MADERFTFEQARIRLEEIAVEVRKKDTSLEKSLDLLEEGVRLANICTELVDHTDVGATVTVPVPEQVESDAPADGSVADDADASGEQAGEAPVDEAVVATDAAPEVDDADGFDDADDVTGETPDAGIED